MKRVSVVFLAIMMAATIASAQHGGGPGRGPEGGEPGGGAIVGSDGTISLSNGTTITAVRSTGTVAWTATVSGHAILSDGNLIVESATRNSDGTVTTTLTAISTASGAT